MTKVTIATDERGNVVGAVQHGTGTNPGGMKGEGQFGPEHKLHTVDLPPELDMTKVKDVATFHQALQRHVPKGH
jgi:hypothetical protein